MRYLVRAPEGQERRARALALEVCHEFVGQTAFEKVMRVSTDDELKDMRDALLHGKSRSRVRGLVWLDLLDLLDDGVQFDVDVAKGLLQKGAAKDCCVLLSADSSRRKEAEAISKELSFNEHTLDDAAGRCRLTSRVPG